MIKFQDLSTELLTLHDLITGCAFSENKDSSNTNNIVGIQQAYTA